MVSVVAFVVRVILVPADKVNVSASASATILSWPDIVIVLNASETPPPPWAEANLPPAVLPSPTYIEGFKLLWVH